MRAELHRYGTESYEPEVARVRAAILRLADGRQSELCAAVEVAKERQPVRSRFEPVEK